MRRVRTYLSLLLLIGAAGAAAAGQGVAPPPAAPAQTPAVDEIVAMNLKARGGVDLLRETESMKMTGTMTTPRGQAKLTVWMKRPNRKRTETELVSTASDAAAGPRTKRVIEGFDGTTSWVAVDSMPPQILPPTPQLEEAKSRSEIDPLLLDYKERGRTVSLVAREKADGGEVFHLRIVEKGRVTHYYIDAATGLDKKVSNRVTSLDGALAAQQELRFLDYRDIQGRMVPFTIQQVLNGDVIGHTKVETVEFNIPIADAIFKMPGSAPRLP